MTDDVEIVTEDQPEDGEDRSAIHEPGKLMRIAVMLRELQEEVRRAPTDEAGRDRLRVVNERAMTELKSALSGDLTDELSTLTLPFDDGTPSESEILIAQAQLIGWLEGLFQGIQAALMSQQLQSRQQLEQMRQRGLPPGMVPPGQMQGQPGQAQGQGEQGQSTGTGQYL